MYCLTETGYQQKSHYIYIVVTGAPLRAISHNVIYYQQLSIACYQVSFYACNYVAITNIVQCL